MIRIRDRPMERTRRGDAVDIRETETPARKVDLKSSVHSYNMKLRPKANSLVLLRHENRTLEAFSKNDIEDVFRVSRILLIFTISFFRYF